jgi:N-acetylneuraminate synthase
MPGSVPGAEPRPFKIGAREIGAGGPCLIVAEIAQSHEGSVGQARAFIEAVANAGADAVKFQTHIAAAESTPAEPWRVTFSRQDSSRYDYWKRMEFSEDQWSGLKAHAESVGLIFLSSPFSIEAVDLLERVGMPAWKIASGEVANTVLLDRILAAGGPVLLSTGMSPWKEIDAAVGRIEAAGAPYAVLQCTSVYPCPPESAGLNVLGELRERYGCLVGLSDHSGTIYPGLAAAAYGISVLEAHVTPSRELFGPDVPSSVTTAELRQLVQGIRCIETMLRHPVDKDAMARTLSPLRSIFMKSIVARADLAAGTLLDLEHLAAKKPGTGIPASEMRSLVGRRLRRDVRSDELIRQEDLA